MSQTRRSTAWPSAGRGIGMGLLTTLRRGSSFVSAPFKLAAPAAEHRGLPRASAGRCRSGLRIGGGILLWLGALALPGPAAESPAGPPPPTAAEQAMFAALLRALDSTEPLVKEHAIRALGDHGQDAVPHLLKIVALSPAVDDQQLAAWIRLLGDREFRTREDASQRLLPHAAQAYFQLRVAARNADPEVRVRAAAILDDYLAINARGPAANERDSNNRQIQEALASLAKIGPDASAAVPAAMARLGANDPGIRRQACTLLARIGPRARPAIPCLLETLQDDDPACRRSAALALGALGADDPVVLSRLLQTLTDPSADVADGAVEALGHFPAQAAQIVPPLSRRLDRVSGPSWTLTAAWLMRLGDQAVWPVLSQKLRATDVAQQVQACEAIAAVGHLGKAAVPLLIPLASANEENPAYPAMRALRAIGPAALPELLEALKSEKRAGRIGETLCGFPRDENYRKTLLPHLISRFLEEGTQVNTYVHGMLCNTLAEDGFTESLLPVAKKICQTLTDHPDVTFFVQNIWRFHDSPHRERLTAMLSEALGQPATRDWAAIAWLDLDKAAAPRVFPVLLDILDQEKNSPPTKRWQLVEAVLVRLAACGPQAAKEAAPRVRSYAQNGPENSSVRLQAVLTIPYVLPANEGIPFLEAMRANARSFLADHIDRALMHYKELEKAKRQ